ncbi:hypothetical protein EJB05_13810, partial [Eragrostis curvula]
MPPPSRRPPALMEELVEEILLRFPPSEPASLFRATLVCKPWRRLICSSGFRRRLREHHRTAPMLGFLCDLKTASDKFDKDDTTFVPTTSFRFPSNAVNPRWRRVVDALHGRVLIVDASEDSCEFPDFLVWNSTDGKVRKLPVPMYTHIWSAALACAAPGCDHLDCDDDSAFRVAVVATDSFGRFTATFVYSSEQGAWSPPKTSVPFQHIMNRCMRGPAARVENKALCFFCVWTKKTLEYDLVNHKLSFVSLPPECKDWDIALMSTEDGALGFTTVLDYNLYLWIREVDDELIINGGARWSQRRVIELDKILPNHALLESPRVLTIVNAVGITFAATPSGHFSIDLKSGRVTDIFEGSDQRYIVRDIVLYRIFRTPGTKIK